MTHKVWVKLLDPSSEWTKVSLEGIDDVDDCKMAFKIRVAPKLDYCAHSDLTVKAIKDGQDLRDAIDLDAMDSLESILKKLEVVNLRSVRESFGDNVRLLISAPSGT